MNVFDHPEFDQHEVCAFLADIAPVCRRLSPSTPARWDPLPVVAGAGSMLTATPHLRTRCGYRAGMTYKNAIAGLRFGGGKSVILANDAAPKSADLFRAFGRAVESLGGKYVTAEDVGCSVEDMRSVNEETKFVSGLPKSGNTPAAIRHR